MSLVHLPQTGAPEAPGLRQVPASVVREQLDSALVQGLVAPGTLLAEARALGRDGGLGLVAIALALVLLGRRAWLWVRAWRVGAGGGTGVPGPGIHGTAPAVEEKLAPDAWRRRLPRKTPPKAPIPLPPHVVAVLERLAEERAVGMPGSPSGEARATRDSAVTAEGGARKRDVRKRDARGGGVREGGGGEPREGSDSDAGNGGTGGGLDLWIGR